MSTRNGTKSAFLSQNDSQERMNHTRQADQNSEASTAIKQTVKRTMYSAFPEMKDQKLKGKLDEM